MKPFLFITLVSLIFSSVWNAAGDNTNPPNFIILLTDDLGYHDIGFHGCRDVATPNLDSLVQHGVNFSSGYVASPLSSPSRAGLLTGRYPARFGYERDPEWKTGGSNPGLPLTEITMADILGEAGYVSGFIGKWHLGNQPAMHPLRRGFDEFFGFLGAGHMYFPEEFTDPGHGKPNNSIESWHYWIQRDNEPVSITNYLTDAFSDEAVNFISRHKNQPFLLIVAYNAPHSPMEAPEKYLNRCSNISTGRRRICAAMIAAVDDGVGRILNELNNDGLTRQTVVTFLSASGGGLDANCSDNYPLRGSRDYVYEGGWRVPFAMQWLGHLPTGLTFDSPVLSLDLFPTFAVLARAPLPPTHPLDGVNLIPYLLGQKADIPHPQCFVRMPDRDAFALRSGNFKLITPSHGRPAELYNLASDISECRNLAQSEPGILKQLQAEGTAWSHQMMSPTLLSYPAQNPPPRPIDTETGK